MKHYLRNGASAYMYWNISTANGGMSTWGWAQNSLVSVDSTAKGFHYNHDYYLLKHLTHFVDLGARALMTTGTCDDTLAFLNPDKSVVLLMRNELPHPQRVEVRVRDQSAMVELPAGSTGPQGRTNASAPPFACQNISGVSSSKAATFSLGVPLCLPIV